MKKNFFLQDGMDTVHEKIKDIALKNPKIRSSHITVLNHKIEIYEIIFCRVIYNTLCVIATGYKDNIYLYRCGLSSKTVECEKIENNYSLIYFCLIHNGSPYALHNSSVDKYYPNSCKYESINNLYNIKLLFCLNDKLYYVVGEEDANVVHIKDLETKTTFKKINISLKNGKFLFFGSYLVCYNSSGYIKINLLNDSRTRGEHKFPHVMYYGFRHNTYHNDNIITFSEKNGNIYTYDFERDIKVELPEVLGHDEDRTYTFRENNMYYSVFFYRKGLKIVINPAKICINESNGNNTIVLNGIEFDLNVLRQRTEYFRESPANPDKPFIYGYYNKDKRIIECFNEYHLNYYKFYIAEGVIVESFIFTLFNICMSFGDIDGNYISEILMREFEKEVVSDTIKSILQDPSRLINIYTNIYWFYKDLCPRFVRMLLKKTNIDELIPHMDEFSLGMMYYMNVDKFAENKNFQRLHKRLHDECYGAYI